MTTQKLPGDRDPKDVISQAIRVNHAGEYGAKRIYEGQLAVIKDAKIAGLIARMRNQELAHLDFFEHEIRNRQVRPSLLMPFWHISGFALGAATALLGPEAAMACTVAVEEVIDEHYAKQIDEIAPTEPLLAEKIAMFQTEEAEHKNIALTNKAEQTLGYPALTSIIKLGCRAAIWLAKRI